MDKKSKEVPVTEIMPIEHLTYKTTAYAPFSNRETWLVDRAMRNEVAYESWKEKAEMCASKYALKHGEGGYCVAAQELAQLYKAYVQNLRAYYLSDSTLFNQAIGDFITCVSWEQIAQKWIDDLSK
jgi:hypothetical protein